MSTKLTCNKELKKRGLLALLIFSSTLDTNRLVEGKREGLEMKGSHQLPV
jgi:hypothetical protein